MSDSIASAHGRPAFPAPDAPAQAWEAVLPAPELMNALGGVRLLRVDPDEGLVQAAFQCRPEFCHSGGTTAQGGFVTGWMDFAMAFSVVAKTGGHSNLASLDINVSFLERVGPGEVIAEGRIVRMGRKVAFLEARLTQNGRLAAKASSSAMLVPMDPSVRLRGG